MRIMNLEDETTGEVPSLNSIKKHVPPQVAGEVVDLSGVLDIQTSVGDEKFTNDLEIGCGHGHWLNAYSDANLDTICIGIDLISKRILRSTNKKFNNKRKNISTKHS